MGMADSNRFTRTLLRSTEPAAPTRRSCIARQPWNVEDRAQGNGVLRVAQALCTASDRVEDI